VPQEYESGRGVSPGEEDGRACFDQVAHIRRHEHAAADRVNIVPGTPGTLQRLAHPFRCRKHHDQFDGANIDSQFETRRTNHRPQFATLQLVFYLPPHVALQRGVVALDFGRQFGEVFPQPISRRLGPERILEKMSVVLCLEIKPPSSRINRSPV
jgi:hypothetical protein